jgi:hypothetical protein
MAIKAIRISLISFGMCAVLKSERASTFNMRPDSLVFTYKIALKCKRFSIIFLEVLRALKNKSKLCSFSIKCAIGNFS